MCSTARSAIPTRVASTAACPATRNGRRLGGRAIVKPVQDAASEVYQSLAPAAASESTPEVAERLSTAATLAGAGGFLDGFAYVGHGHVFANAMTGNVVLLGVEAVSHSWHGSYRHLPPIIMFLLGIWAARALHLPAARRLLPNPYATVLAIEMAILLGLMLAPAHTRDFWITAPIAFAASMQVQTFRSVHKQSYNSTFTTGNLRMLSVGVFDWLFTSDKAAARGTARIFAIICVSFLLGATTGGYTVARIGNWALAIELALLGTVFVQVVAASQPLPSKP